MLLTQDHAYLGESRFPLSQTCGVCIVDVRADADHFARALEVVHTTLGDDPVRWKEKKLVIEGDYTLRMYSRGGEGALQYADISHYKFDAIGTNVWVWKDS